MCRVGLLSLRRFEIFLSLSLSFIKSAPAKTSNEKESESDMISLALCFGERARELCSRPRLEDDGYERGIPEIF